MIKEKLILKSIQDITQFFAKRYGVNITFSLTKDTKTRKELCYNFDISINESDYLLYIIITKVTTIYDVEEWITKHCLYAIKCNNVFKPVSQTFDCGYVN